jgi:hypothetical protein
MKVYHIVHLNVLHYVRPNLEWLSKLWHLKMKKVKSVTNCFSFPNIITLPMYCNIFIYWFICINIITLKSGLWLLELLPSSYAGCGLPYTSSIPSDPFITLTGFPLAFTLMYHIKFTAVLRVPVFIVLTHEQVLKEITWAWYMWTIERFQPVCHSLISPTCNLFSLFVLRCHKLRRGEMHFMFSVMSIG